MRSGCVVTSMPWAPLIWRSMNPGTIHPPLASMSRAPPTRRDRHDQPVVHDERPGRRRRPCRRRRQRHGARRAASASTAPRLPSGTSAGTTRTRDASAEVGEHRRRRLPRRERRRAPSATTAADSVMPPPSATTSTSSVMTHSCTVHATAAATSSPAGRVGGHRPAGADGLGAADLPARGTATPCDHIGMCPISPAAAGRAAPQPAAQHEPGGDARADVDVGQRRVGRRGGGGRTRRARPR